MPNVLPSGFGEVLEAPIGDTDCQTDTYQTSKQFCPGSLEFWRDGLYQANGYAFEEQPDLQSFKIVIDHADRKLIKSLPSPTEVLRVRYRAL